jgi:hypothetical protein
LKKWISEVLSQWKEEGIKINQGASFADIVRAEDLIAYKFPYDFKELYSVINGFVDFEARGFFLSLWSLNRIIDDYEKNKEFIIFCDHSLSVCQYGFHRNKAGIFKTYTHHQQGPIEHIAESFRQAIELINSDSELLF